MTLAGIEPATLRFVAQHRHLGSLNFTIIFGSLNTLKEITDLKKMYVVYCTVMYYCSVRYCSVSWCFPVRLLAAYVAVLSKITAFGNFTPSSPVPNTGACPSNVLPTS